MTHLAICGSGRSKTWFSWDQAVTALLQLSRVKLFTFDHKDNEDGNGYNDTEIMMLPMATVMTMMMKMMMTMLTMKMAMTVIG